jgi:hypothetical protein
VITGSSGISRQTNPDGFGTLAAARFMPAGSPSVFALDVRFQDEDAVKAAITVLTNDRELSPYEHPHQRQ